MTWAFNDAPAFANKKKKKSLSVAPKWAFWLDTLPSKAPHSDYSINARLKSEPLLDNYLPIGLMRRLGGVAIGAFSSHSGGCRFHSHLRPLSRGGVISLCPYGFSPGTLLFLRCTLGKLPKLESPQVWAWEPTVVCLPLAQRWTKGLSWV